MEIKIWPTPRLDRAWIQGFYQDWLVHFLSDAPAGPLPGDLFLIPPVAAEENSIPYQSDSSLTRWKSGAVSCVERLETRYEEAGSAGTRSQSTDRFEFDFGNGCQLTFVSERDWMQGDRTRTLHVSIQGSKVLELILKKTLSGTFYVNWDQPPPDLAQEVDRLAYAWLKYGNWAGILEIFEGYGYIPPAGRSSTLALAVGAAYGATGNFAKAREALVVGLGRPKGLVDLTGDLHYNLARALKELGDLGEAQFHIQAALQLDPANPTYLDLKQKLGG